MVLRGMSQREVERNLPRLKSDVSGGPMVNPDTGQPWSLGTINGDIRAIRKQWRESATQDMAEHVARILAELSEVKRAAWADKDFNAILRAIEKEAKLLGADSPEKQIIIEGDLEKFLSRLPEEYQVAIRNLILTDFVGGGPARANP
jgi:hypothetical protein